MSVVSFRPEFLGRRMSLIPFAPISEEVAPMILNIHLNNFKKMLQQQDISLELSDKLLAALVQWGFSPQYGARPLKDTIEYRLGTPVADRIISGEIVKGNQAGGGGYGLPTNRDPQKVLYDVLEGYETYDRANDVYGVVLTASDGPDAYELDLSATEALRASMNGS